MNLIHTRFTPIALNPPQDNVGSLQCWQHNHIRKPPFISSIPALALSIAIFTTPPSIAYENVRVQDVESDIMRAGLEASADHRLEAAERFFQSYLKQEDPNSASAYSNLGMTHLEMKKTSLAVEDFSKAILLAPQAAVPLLNRAIAYEQLGVDAQANHPDQARIYYTNALEDCIQAIQNDPQEFAAYFNKGNVQMRLEDYQGALESFTKAADLTQIAGYRLRAAIRIPGWRSIQSTADITRTGEKISSIC